MPDPETWQTWRWAIGGGLASVTLGVGWLVRMAWQAGQTLQRIEDRLGHHSEALTDHADRITLHDTRLREVEAAWARNSGRWEATS